MNRNHQQLPGIPDSCFVSLPLRQEYQEFSRNSKYMIFSSIPFISIFLPVTFLLHQVLPGIRLRNAVLLLASLFFYAYGEPVFVLLMIGSAFVNYLAAILIEKVRNSGDKKRAGLILAAAVVLNLGALVLFKYVDFLIGLVNDVFHLSISPTMIPLPLGISFFTFQAMSYVIDVYRGVNKAQRSFFRVLLYISLFPQLIAGPIVKYHDVEKELEDRHANAEDIHLGLRRFLAGLSKKVLIANTMAVTADALFAAPVSDWNAAVTWIGAIAYLMQIYFDFSGYSDMAIGMGRMFGFHFHENFRYPYCSGSIREFWKRWHISMTGWFREYLYFSLGGNRRGRIRTVINRLIVFVCTGIWHGASLTFLLWGIYHGLLMMLEEVLPFFRREGGRVKKILMHGYTMLAVLLGFVIFRAESIRDGFTWIGRMFTGFASNPSAMSLARMQLNPLFLTALAAAVAASCPVVEKLRERKGYEITADLVSILGLAACVLSLAGGAYNPFIYFRF